MAFTAVDGRRLVDAHRDGDDAAFPAIVRAHRSGLLARARYRLGDDQAAEDAVQECLLRAYRALPSFGGAGDWHVSAWLYRILENVCIDEGNRRRRAMTIVQRLAAQPEELVPGPDDAIQLANPQVSGAVDGLPAPYRDALIQREVDGMSYADIAAAAGISEDNARARVSRARSALRRLIGPVVAAFAWIMGTTRRGERMLLEGTQAASSTTAVAVAPAASHLPAAVNLPAATQLISQVTAVVPESQIASAIKVATAAVIAVALPVGGVTAATRAEAPPAPAPQAIEVTQASEDPVGSPEAVGDVESPAAVLAPLADVDSATEEIAGAVDAGEAASEEAASEDASTGTDGPTADETDGTADETTEGDGTDSAAEEPAPTSPDEGTDQPSEEPVQASGAVVLDTSAVYRNTLDDGRYELAGPTSFSTSAGEFAGRLTITCAVPQEDDAPDTEYRLAGSLVVSGERAGRIRLAGAMEAWSVDADGVTTYVFSGRYQVVDGGGYGLPPKGSFTASFRGTGRSDLVVRLVPNSSSSTAS